MKTQHHSLHPVPLLLVLACLLIISSPCSAQEELIIVGSAPAKHRYTLKPAIFVPSTGQLFIKVNAKATRCNNTFFFYNTRHREFITSCLDKEFGTRIITDPLDAKNRHNKRARDPVYAPSEEVKHENFVMWFADWDDVNQILCMTGKDYMQKAPLRLICHRRNKIEKGFTLLTDKNIDAQFFLIQNLMVYKGKAVLAGRKSKRNTKRFELVYDPIGNKQVSWRKAEYGRLLGKLNQDQLAVYKDGNIYGYDLTTQTRFTELPDFPFQRFYGKIGNKKEAYVANSNGLKRIDKQENVFTVDMYNTKYVYDLLGASREAKFKPSSGAHVDLKHLNLNQICHDIGIRWCPYKDHKNDWPEWRLRGMSGEYCYKRYGMCIRMSPSATFETDFIKVYGGTEGKQLAKPP